MYKDCILDPLTTICKLALLTFLPDDTKISIGQHTIQFQNGSQYQWLQRLSKGDTRQDISQLVIPIHRMIQWYMKDERLPNDFKLALKIIVDYAILGLRKLQITYTDDLTMQIVIQFLMNLLRQALNDKFDEQEIPFSVSIHENPLSKNIRSNNDQKILIVTIAKFFQSSCEQQDNIEFKMHSIAECVQVLLTHQDMLFSKMMYDVVRKF